MKRKTQIVFIILLGLFLNVTAQSNNNTELEVLVERAKKAGLDNDRIIKFLDLIKQKEAALLEIKNSSKDESIYGILESPMQKTNTEVKMEFAKNLANLISKEEYLSILEEEIKQAATKEATKEMNNVLKAHELTDDQKKKVYALIAHYYLNQSVTKAYYLYDKKLKEQKLSALRFYFEKNYKKLMESFGIELGISKKVDTNTFQY
ncbi:hypothetical protein ACFQ1R_06770 [Mariniflexile jejuense]|uniref:DUF4476 domain-containing protein n=1 Tax=Mariniflexile jejuense TaxID=1173582 RepID=A0ABW3JHS0_9FLAO